MNKFSAIIVAAGSGKRFGSEIPKQFLPIKEKPLLQYTLEAFDKSPVDEIILVLSKEYIDKASEFGLNIGGLSTPVLMCEGGKERVDSVNNGINMASGDYVLIHDGARPFVSARLISDCMEAACKYDACIAAVPVTDTIKESNGDMIVSRTIPREKLWSVQTPQGFRSEALREAFLGLSKLPKEKRALITDDAMAVENVLGISVHIVMGDYNNIKITTKEDILFAKMIASNL